MGIAIKQAKTEDEMAICLDIRRRVFIEEQKVSEAEEIDGLDDSSDHYILYLNSLSVGTARVRYKDAMAKIERVAVLANYRGLGLGKKLMLYLIREIRNSNNAHTIMLGAQTHAIQFYESIGFQECGAEYMDAGIPHKDMKMLIDGK
ncbi:MAG: GNAT family N-acetyltransferase [Proteobacteria bacterium]|nr:GNAT family N-acetyltransferase [Pseudomonadota bacterium]